MNKPASLKKRDEQELSVSFELMIAGSLFFALIFGIIGLIFYHYGVFL